ncbi:MULTISPECIES: hypothetical protein [Caballeronia]|uniref:Uncharacterized protein n=2 Tax=Caballeronia TaxID=1827195 RepID=A0AA37I9H5_9BURK|nr:MULTISPECIES: hypothetical protein [Caballeronia]GJH24952.1 hypothetical protein CBA19CS42_10570 [Caballeronia novacaledonica]
MATRYFKLSHDAAISRQCRDRDDDAAATSIERGFAEKERIYPRISPTQDEGIPSNISV